MAGALLSESVDSGFRVALRAVARTNALASRFCRSPCPFPEIQGESLVRARSSGVPRSTPRPKRSSTPRPTRKR
eukprot:5611981-Lingulodinium_polyedra.AAC.1